MEARSQISSRCKYRHFHIYHHVKQKGRIRENVKHNIEKNPMRINKQSPVILIGLSDQSIFVPQQL